MKKVLKKSGRLSDPGEAVGMMIEKRISLRKACTLARVGRKIYRYERRERGSDAMAERIKEMAVKYPRFGYRRIWAMLIRAGEAVNIETVYRWWKSLNLKLASKMPKKQRPAATQLLPGGGSDMDIRFHVRSGGVGAKAEDAHR